MRFLYWLLGLSSNRARAMWLYKRGLAHASAHEHLAALADYTAVIEMPGGLGDLQAMALFNRSMVYSATHHEAEAIRDLERLLEMPKATGHVKQEARRKLVRMQKTSDRAEQQRVEQHRVEEQRVEQHRAEQQRVEQHRAEQQRTKPKP